VGSIETLLARARAQRRGTRLAPAPKLRAVILTCMDARIDPVALFGLEPGDVHVLRNAGARAASDVLRSIALSQAILGTREVLVLGHTRCGLFEQTEAELAETIRLHGGHDPQMQLGAFDDLDAAVDETVEAVRACPFLAHRDGVRGFVYELDTGDVRPTVATAHRKPRAVASIRRSGLDMLRADVLNLKGKPRR
jgi:carbonic anhydrase